MDLKQIAEFLKAEREKQGLLPFHMRSETNLHSDTITAIESGETGYNIKALLAYCKRLNYEIQIIPSDLPF